MPKISYVNGRYVAHGQAMVHMEDRGYQFADGVYEVIAVYNGHIIDEEPHLERLDRSLGELAIDWPVAMAALKFILRQVRRRNAIKYGNLYLQITRGQSARNHAYPDNIKPVLTITGRTIQWPTRDQALIGQNIISTPDLRWKRCDIKSVSLLPNILSKMDAIAANAGEAWMIDEDGMITEGTSSNAWIVTGGGEIITRHLDNAILAGVTRRAVFEIADRENLNIVERAFSLAEAKAAQEAFFTSTTALVKPAVRIDDAIINDGKPGPFTIKLLNYYYDYLDQSTV